MHKRIKLIMVAIGALLIIVTVRTAYLQLWDGPNSGIALAEKALKYRSQAIPGEEYYRGEILDRNLLSMTDSGIRQTLVAYPGSIEDINYTANRLSEIIGLSTNEIENIISRAKGTYGNNTPLIIKTNLSYEEIQKLEEESINGIAVIPIKNRYGPNSLARHLIGYVNSIDANQWEKLSEQKLTTTTNNQLPSAYKVTDKIGVAGLENKYESILRGARAEYKVLGISDANGQLMKGLGYKIQQGSMDIWRNHLVLTLDRRYQEIVEKVMDENVERGAVVVLDVPTGDVLAVASRPNFDQNYINRHLEGFDEFLNRADRVAFYPGSVFKPVVAMGVLEENLLQQDERFICSGKYVFPDQTEIKCLLEHGTINLEEAFIRSCNSTFVQLGLRLGSSKLSEYAEKLGFAINIKATAPPALVGNASIGQEGVLVSPLQIANLYAVLARGGYYRAWRTVAEIRSPQGEIIQEYPLKPPVRVVSEETCAIIQAALTKVVESGSGREAWVEGKGTAGKTGTAEVNETDKVIAWFAGYTPVNEPRFVIVVMVEENKHGVQTGLRGGKNAAPVFRQIAEQLFQLEDDGNDKAN